MIPLSKRRIILIFLTLVLLIFSISLVWLFRQPPPFAYPPAGDEPFRTIQELSDLNITPGNYTTEGFIAFISVCPACPWMAQCEPCVPPHIVLSEQDQILDTYLLTNREILVYLPETTTSLRPGQKLRATIQVASGNLGPARILIGYTQIK